MIKVDIVNEVSKIADITKVKAEVAVDAVFDAMRVSMQRGDRIELRGFGVFQVKARMGSSSDFPDIALPPPRPPEEPPVFVMPATPSYRLRREPLWRYVILFA